MNEDTPKHNPEEIEARITALLLGELTPAEEAEIRRAIERNSDLARLHDRLKDAIEFVRDAVTQPVEAAVAQPSLPRLSEERRQNLLQRFKTVTPKKLNAPRRRGVPWFVPMGIAAALMALLTLGRLVSWDEFSIYESKTLLFPRVLANRQLSEERLDQFRSRIAGDTKDESAGSKTTPSLSSRVRRNVGDARGESLSRSSGAEQTGRGQVSPTPQPANRVASRLIYLPGQNNEDKPAEVAQVTKLSEESGKNEPVNPTPLAPLMMNRTLGRTTSEAKKEAESSFGIQFDTLPIPENAPLIGSPLVNGIAFPESGQSVVNKAEPTAQPNSFTAAPATILNLDDNSQLGWMFTAPPSELELALSQSEKTESLPLVDLGLVAGTSADANSQTGLGANFSLASSSPAAWGDYDNDGRLAQQNFSTALPSPATTQGAVIGRFNTPSKAVNEPRLLEAPASRIDALDGQPETGSVTTTAPRGTSANAAGFLDVSRRVQEEKLIQADKAETPGLIITAQSSADPPPANPPAASETTAFFMNESVAQAQTVAPVGGTQDSKLAERSKTENSKQDGLAQPVNAGNPAEESSVSRSSSEKEASRPSFMDPRMMARYFGGKMPAGSPGAQADGKPDSLEKMSEEKRSLATPTIHALADQITGVNGREALAEVNREQEQPGSSLVKRKALEENLDKVDFAKALSSDGKNITQLGESEKDKLAEQRLANVELKADYRDSRQDRGKQQGVQLLNQALAEQEKKIAQTKELEHLQRESRGKADVSPARPVAPVGVPQPDVATQENAFSTFSLNVTDVSFKLAAASLEKGVLPEPATVRSEEFINAFNYRDPEPALGAPVAFAWERAQYPYAHNRELIRFAVRTAARGRETGRPLNLVLLLDNSGSMERADRVRIIREALVVLARQLQPYDRISVVAFARTARLWVDALPGNQAGELAERVGNLPPDGGTNLEEALNLAYTTAASHFLSQGVNRVVLLTDGAANLGEVNPESLRRKVESWRQRGVALDCFGIGWEGYNDDLLEVLSRNGDGRYGFVNTPDEATTEFAAQLAGALQVAASDVKVQVEFNPRRVEVWRQIGYAKHQLTKQQFRDNSVDAAELAAAESGNALYVIQVNRDGAGPIGLVRVRYREPDTSYYREHEWPVPYTGAALPLDGANASLRLAATASALSEWLVSSPFAGEVTPDRLLNYLQGVPAAFEPDPRPQKLEWMIRQAKSISGK